MLNSIISRIGDIATAKSVYGEPVAAHGRTIIPVARIGCGFGGGSGKDRHSEDVKGEGGGGGLMAIPLGVYEISDSGTKFIPLHDKRKLLAAVYLGFCLGMILRHKSNSR
ncbi:MAG: spore germination protein GerW family protein [Acidobacteriota bacterium]